MTPRHVLACGASQGIGRAAALELGRRGRRVTGLARGRDGLESLCGELRALGAPDPGFVTADLDDLPQALDAVDTVLRDRGPVQVLVLNTGGPPPGPLLETAPEALLAAFRRHVVASHELARRVLPGMRDAGFGRIVCVVSVSVREPLPNLGASNVVRAGVAAWAKTLALELPPGITINCVLPGYTATGRLLSLAERTAEASGSTPDAVIDAWVQAVPEARVGRPEEIAAAVAFLASDEASYIRGITLPVDGGRLRSV